MSKSMLMMTTYPTAAQPRLAPHVARALGAASRFLGRLAARLSAAPAGPPAPALPPVLEFYASAGAPEGALYLDGELVGTLHGVTRL